MKNTTLYFLLIITMVSCSILENIPNDTREFFYPIKSRFVVFEEAKIEVSKTYNYKTTNNYRNEYKNENLFTLRIKEKQKYVELENGTVSELPYRHFFADTLQPLYDKDILEETYLYVDGLSDKKERGLAIFFNTFPVISAEQDSNYLESDKVFLNSTKSMKTGLWLKQEDQLYILFNTGKDDVPIIAEIQYQLIQGDSIAKAINLVEIAHPQSINKAIHKEKMENFKTALYEHDVYEKSEKSEYLESNKFDLDYPTSFIDSLITTFFTSTTLKMNNVFDVNEADGLPFIVNSLDRTPGIEHDSIFHQWTHFEVIEDHRIVFETEYKNENGATRKKSFVYKEKYLSNLSFR